MTSACGAVNWLGCVGRTVPSLNEYAELMERMICFLLSAEMIAGGLLPR